MKPSIKEYSTGLIKRTGNPIAQILFNELVNRTEQMGKTLAVISKEETINVFRTKLLSGFTDEELDALGGTPEFIMLLCSMLKTSLVNFTNESV